MTREYKVISGDAHLELSPASWTRHVPSKWRKFAPRCVRLASGEDAIVIGDSKPRKAAVTLSVRPPYGLESVPTFENNAGAGGPDQRLREQDQDGVDAEILFSRLGFLREVKEDEGYLALNHAYNEYLAEDYCAVAPDRLIAMGVIPTTGVEDAIAELEYCARTGLKGVLIDRFPNGTGHPAPEDDRFWAAAMDLSMPITAHTFGGRTQFPDEGSTFQASGAIDSARPNHLSHMFRFASEAPFVCIQMAYAGVWDRFPDLRVYWAETQIGWLPYTLWTMDANYDHYRDFWKGTWGIEFLKHPPSEYVRQHCLWGFLADPVGVGTRHATGIDKLLWGADFPHPVSEWPRSRESIETNFAGVPEEERSTMLAGNAIRFFHLIDK